MNWLHYCENTSIKLIKFSILCNGKRIVKYKKYNKYLLVISISIILGIILLNYLVNPYNIFKQRIFPETLLKPEAKIQERVTKPIGLKIDNRKIDAVFFGTSRADLGLDKNHYKEITGKEAENIAIGGLHFNEMLDAIDIAIKIHPEIKHVYIGLDYAVFLKSKDNTNDNRATITKNPKLETQELGIALLCLKTTGNSIWTVIKNLSGNKRRMFYPSGKKYIFVNKKIKKDFELSWKEYNKAYAAAVLDDNKLEMFADYCKKLNRKGIKVTLFIMPSHITEFYFIYKTGNWENYSNWKKGLAAISPVYDFQYPNIYTTDKIRPDMKTFFDASHCTYLVGNKIIDDIVLKKTDLARLITKENADAINKKNLKDIVNWSKTDKETINWINKTINEEK